MTSHYQIDGSTVDKYERLSEIWTLGEESVFDPGGGITVPAIAARWAATFDHHNSTVTTLAGPCQQQFVLQTTDGAGAGTHMSQLAVSEAPGGVVYLSATSAMPGMFTVPMVSYAETCGGIVVGVEQRHERHRAAARRVGVLAAHAGGGESGAVPGEQGGGASGDAADGGE